jgi:ribosome production factor 1
MGRSIMGSGKSKSKASERKPDDVSHIKNKQKRSAVLARVRDAKARAKKEAKTLELEKAQAEGRTIEKQVPPTVESQREPDETHVEEGDSEVEGDLNDDEFAEYFKGQAPRTVITTCKRPTKIM